MNKLIDFWSYPVRPVLSRLLQDKTTKQNIIFATDAYRANGDDFSERSQITAEKILGLHKIKIQPRVEKAAAEQIARTRKKAEVFTPSWIVNKMNNHCDEAWFGLPNIFNTENGTNWITNPEPIRFEGKKTWEKYVDSRRIEITCGEAPYIVSRYDTTTGSVIPVENRIGLLDRKLRVVNENAADDDEWEMWTERAFQSSYGYEFQGDNLLIARVNLLITYVEHYERRFGSPPNISLLRKYANIICWNFWQMDGLTGTVPFGGPKLTDDEQTALEECQSGGEGGAALPCKIRNWRGHRFLLYNDLKG